MNTDQVNFIQGKQIEILEMNLIRINSYLELFLKLYVTNMFVEITFHNVSRLKMQNLSAPLQVQGFEIINHSQKGWDLDSKFEIRDFEDDRINFFCEHFEIL